MQMPKSEHVTLPSVEMWGSNMNILRDPPRSVFTRKKEYVTDTNMILDWTEDSKDRACEFIRQYPRGVNPMVNVSYTNNNSGTTAIGTQSAQTQAFLPYRVMRDGAFRLPPNLFDPLNTLPLSRLPRVWTKATTNVDFPNYAKKIECPSYVREASKKQVQAEIRPTATYSLQQASEEIDTNQFIIDKQFYNVDSALRGFDIQDNTNAQSINPLEYINETTIYSPVQTNIYSLTQSDYTDRQCKTDIRTKDMLYTPRVAAVSGVDKNGEIHRDMTLDRKMPAMAFSANPATSRKYVNPSATQMKLKDTLSAGPIDGTKNIPQIHKTNQNIKLERKVGLARTK